MACFRLVLSPDLSSSSSPIFLLSVSADLLSFFLSKFFFFSLTCIFHCMTAKAYVEPRLREVTCQFPRTSPSWRETHWIRPQFHIYGQIPPPLLPRHMRRAEARSFVQICSSLLPSFYSNFLNLGRALYNKTCALFSFLSFSESLHWLLIWSAVAYFRLDSCSHLISLPLPYFPSVSSSSIFEWGGLF